MLCLVFEFLDLDLKKYMDAASAADGGMAMDLGTGVPSPKGKGRARRGLPSDLVAVSLARTRCETPQARIADARLCDRNCSRNCSSDLRISTRGTLSVAPFLLRGQAAH